MHTLRKQRCLHKGPGFCTGFLFLTLLLITRRSLQRKRWFHKERTTLVKAAREAEAGGMVPHPRPLPVHVQGWDSVNPRGATGAQALCLCLHRGATGVSALSALTFCDPRLPSSCSCSG